MNETSPHAVLLDLMSQASRGIARGLLTLDATGVVVGVDARAAEALGVPSLGQRLDVLVPFLTTSKGWPQALVERRPSLFEGTTTGVCGVALSPTTDGFVAALLVAPIIDVAFQATPAVVLVLDADARVVEANELATALFGASGTDLRQRVITELIPSEVLASAVQSTLVGEAPPGLVSFEWQRPEGRRIFDLLCRRVSGAGSLCVLTLVDVTIERHLAVERERLLEAVHQSQKLDAIGQLASGVAHDMNNVLAVVQTCAGALRDEVHEALHKADAEQILLATQRARDLLHQLLSFARKTPARSETFDIFDMAREASGLVMRLLPANVRFVLRLPSQSCEVKGDRSQLLQTLINICLNARDAMPDGGVITLSSECNERRVTFTVVDTGEGMAPEVIQRAFEPFFSTKKRGSGTGLGLSMAYTSVRAHRGDIRLESQPGRGTKVTLWLPRELAEFSDTDVVTPVTFHRGIAMVVDDDDATRLVLGRFLKKLGYAVHLVSSGQEAVSMLRAGLRPSLVVCDLVMPGLSGDETMTQLKALEPAVNVVITSGFLDESDESQMQQAGALGLLRKPFSMDDVVQVVSTLRS
jgi:signal transduction histidine kinase/CheY-like chemotaxis protein